MRTRFLLLLAPLLATGGCSTALKHAYYEIRGAQADLVFNSPPAGRPLAAYQEVQFAPPTTTLSERICPPVLLSAYRRHADELRADLADAYPGGAPAAVVASEVLYFQRIGLLSGAQLLTRVRIRGSDAEPVDMIVKAESKSFREGGEEDLVQATLKALARFLRDQKGLAERPADEAED